MAKLGRIAKKIFYFVFKFRIHFAQKAIVTNYVRLHSLSVPQREMAFCTCSDFFDFF